MKSFLCLDLYLHYVLAIFEGNLTFHIEQKGQGNKNDLIDDLSKLKFQTAP